MRILPIAELRPKFWERFALDALTSAEWEALCDGCGRCCLLKLEDDETEHVHYTSLACRLLDGESCRCSNYPLRRQIVAGCVVLTPENIARISHWMPETCAYRLLHEGDTLPQWHPLISNDAGSVQAAGVSVAGLTTPEYEVPEEEWEAHLWDLPAPRCT